MTLDLKMKNTFSYRVLKIFLVLLIFVYLLYYRIYHAGYDMLTSEISRSLYSKSYPSDRHNGRGNRENPATRV